MADIDNVTTLVKEGEDFYQRNVGELGRTAASIGGLFWGLLAAVAECPNCAGSFRCPIGGDEHEELWRCAKCGGVWARKRRSEEAEKAKVR